MLIQLDAKQTLPFHNHAACIGTGRMGLALQQSYQEQLILVQKGIGFSFIRGHGLFHEDVSIYHRKEENGREIEEYNFTYLDQILDRYHAQGLRPFLELGFMPKAMASGTQTAFYWEGNVTPPKDDAAWLRLVQATIRHCIIRYGLNEVAQWRFEIWNEPNLQAFWPNADKTAYFHLYEETANEIKRISPRLLVGGPAICGVDDAQWLQDFLEFCLQSGAPVDFVSRHAYATLEPDHIGHYIYHDLQAPDDLLAELQTSRTIIDRFPAFHGMPMHLTEFNTSYSPICPLHDTNLNAAYIAYLLAFLGDTCETYSYWTFGDVFEENGVPFTPFHGGFGLVANGLIPKPTFWTFAFFNRLDGICIYRDKNSVVIKTADDVYRGVAWNPDYRPVAEVTASPTLPPLEIAYSLPLPDNRYCIQTETVDEETCNPLRAWDAIGAPPSPTAEQNALLQRSAQPKLTVETKSAADGRLSFSLHLQRNAVVYFSIWAAPLHVDNGYIPERIQGLKV